MTRINLLSWNVNSLRARYKDNHLDWLFKENPEIICFQETKGSEDQLRREIKDIGDYHAYYFSAVESRYAGAGIFTQEEPVSVQSSLGDGKFASEGRIVKAEFDEFTLINIYFPSGADNDKMVQEEKMKRKYAFYSHFLEHMEHLSDFSENVVICGDFNIAHNQIDLTNPKRASRSPGFLQQERALIDRLIAHGYLDTFRIFNQEGGNYTWWPYGYNAREKNVGMRLDHIFVSESLKDNVKDAYIRHAIMGSDHCPIGVEIKL